MSWYEEEEEGGEEEEEESGLVAPSPPSPFTAPFTITREGRGGGRAAAGAATCSPPLPPSTKKEAPGRGTSPKCRWLGLGLKLWLRGGIGGGFISTSSSSSLPDSSRTSTSPFSKFPSSPPPPPPLSSCCCILSDCLMGISKPNSSSSLPSSIPGCSKGEIGGPEREREKSHQSSFSFF